MSRIDSSECFCIDMEWYGVDKKGNIAVFCSAGEGYLPEFVCEDVERAEELMEYFDAVEKITDSALFFKSIEQAEQVATLHEYYTKLSAPLRPLEYERLPEHIRDLLGHNHSDFGLARCGGLP